MMTLFRIVPACVVLVAATAAGAADLKENPGLVLHTSPRDVIRDKTGIAVPAADVRPGDIFTITGECVDPADTLRVVLTLADVPAPPPGFRSVLPTDQETTGNSLQVRVPDMPETANRVFSVKVFRLGKTVPVICDAGSIRIGGSAQGKVG